MARTRPVNPPGTQPSSSVTQRAVKSTSKTNKTTTSTRGSQAQTTINRPTTSQKTPAHLFQHVGQGSTGGKTYFPRPPQKPRRKRRKIVAPPHGPKPVKQGAGALHEINYYQRNTGNLVPKKPFERLVREIAQDYNLDIRFAPGAIEAIQEAMEAYIVQLHADALLLALHARRVTVMPRDVRLLMMLRRNIGRPL